MGLRARGILGFSVYLLHIFVIAVANQTAFWSPGKLAISTVFVLTFAKITYDSIERPFMELSNRLAERRWAVRAMASPASRQHGRK